MTQRTQQIAAGLAAVHERIAAACAASGRDPAEITLVVVTKTFPADDVRRLADLGVRDVAENRDQEARAKAAACADLPLRWHFVGQLQTNKARSVTGYAAAVHSLDRARLAQALAAGAQAHGRPVRCLVQVNLDPAPASGGRGPAAARGGTAPADVPALAADVAALPALVLGGVMAIAPLAGDPAAAFRRLARLAAQVRARHPGATWMSAGMSTDLEAAIGAGATHVRVGTAILGSRPPAD